MNEIMCNTCGNIWKSALTNVCPRCRVEYKEKKMNNELTELENQFARMVEEQEKLGKRIEELKSKPKKLVVDSFEELGMIGGAYIKDDSEIIKTIPSCANDPRNYNIWPTTELAKAVQAKCKLSQIMYRAWGKWRPIWTSSEIKHVIYFVEGEIETSFNRYMENFLCFPTEEMRDEFLEKHRELIMEARLAL